MCIAPQLSTHLESSATPSAIEGALDVLAKICEDVPDRMVADASQPLDTILPKVFALLTAQNDKWRAYSLEIINRFIMLDPPVMQQNIQALLQAIFHLTGDPSASVRKQVIIGINQLVEYRFSDVLPHMNGVIEFMLVSKLLCRWLWTAQALTSSDIDRHAHPPRSRAAVKFFAAALKTRVRSTR